MRAASTYRGARRNHARANHLFADWRGMNAIVANGNADLQARQVVANGAREAAAKALTDANVLFKGLSRNVVVASALLAYYRGIKRTRPVNRIIRDLEKQVRSTARTA